MKSNQFFRFSATAVKIICMGILIQLNGCATSNQSTPADKPGIRLDQPSETTPTAIPAAVRAIDLKLKSDPKNSELIYQKASMFAKAEMWQPTLENAEKAIKRNDKDARFWLLKGVAERKLGLLANAETSYEKSLNLNPQFALAHFNLGILHDLYLNQPNKAVHHFEAFQRLQKAPDKKVELWLTEMKQRLHKNPL